MGDVAALSSPAVGAASSEKLAFSFVPEPMLSVAKLQLYRGQGADALSSALGLSLPPQRRYVSVGGLDCAWLAPDEWLLTGPSDAVTSALARAEGGADKLLLLAIDVTHGRASYRVFGHSARERLAVHCPLDLRSSKFPARAVARSLFGEAGLFLARLPDEHGAPCFRAIVDQTMAPYFVRLLATGAEP